MNQAVGALPEASPEAGRSIPWADLSAAPLQGHLLSNGTYRTLITATGSGFSECAGQALTRWRADRIEDGQGLFIYLRDLDRDRLWSAGHEPVRRRPDRYRAEFGAGRAAILRSDDGIDSSLEIAVLAEAPGEVRRLTLRNASPLPRRLEVTTCLEAVLNSREADAAHPAFSKLFVQTEWHAPSRALLARRRPRGADEAPRWMFHWLAEGAAEGLSFETDRARFLGRGRTLAAPQALRSAEPLSGSTGNVLDPVLALHSVVLLQPGESRTLSFGLGYADHREEALALCTRYADGAAIAAALRAAGAAAEADGLRFGLSPQEALACTQVAADLLYGPADPVGTVATSEPLAPLDGLAGGPGAPLLLLDLAGPEAARSADLLRRALPYWRQLGFQLRVAVLGPAHARPSWTGKDPVAFLDAAALSALQRQALMRQARLVLGGPAAGARAAGPLPEAAFLPGAEPAAQPSRPPAGFSEDGTEYILHVDPLPDGQPGLPPMPWSNVIANEGFGFLATERGLSCVWSRNSRLNRLTPWLNDPVADPLPEALYLRDEEARTYWSPQPGPCGSGIPFTVRHGFGYTRWESAVAGLAQEVTAFVPRTDPLRVVRIRLRNSGPRARRLSLLWHARLVLGETAERCAGQLDTRREGGALFAWNAAPAALAPQVAFAALQPEADGGSASTDRAAFIGRDGSLAAPAAVTRPGDLDGRTGAGLDAGFALQARIELAPGETRDCILLFGEAASLDAARALLAAYAHPEAAEAALAEVRAFWRDTVGGLRIQTPEPALDPLVNGWLPYQNLSCRLWGRTAYYQSGGAFGFRDELQDAAALLYLRPALTRRQLLLHAAHQFQEGDVLHWWHPPTEEGIRTGFSDDLLWLPQVAAYYVQSTGDWAILAEQLPYLRARLLAPGEDEAYLAPVDSGERGDLYEHCCRALDRSLARTGRHGLPLMGTGDWNDGMNRVGRLGQGESVWMGFFLYAILEAFKPLCVRRGDAARVRQFEAAQLRLTEALETAGWDGEWYRRAYYDDGTPLGSALSQECRIDCLAQAWAVISRAVPEHRARQAMQAAEQQLIDDEAGMIRLLAPPFDTCDQDPGYIKGYLPGVRENGGQYTHAALWAVKAMAELGEVDRSAALLAMLSPVAHTADAAAVARYQTEPYAVAADVYGVGPLRGRGGWTWYTGSAGWMYRVAIEDLFGFRLHQGEAILLRPRLPSSWDTAGLTYRDPATGTAYVIRLERDPSELRAGTAELDGLPLLPAGGELRIPLSGDGAEHAVRVVFGAPQAPAGSGPR